jgi:flagellar basal body-associated protein FliL
MKKKKVLIPLLVIVIVGVAAKFVLAKPAPVEHHKIDGTVYVLPKEFLLNLSDGRYAKLNVALVLAPGQPSAPAGGGESGGATPPEGFGTLEQEAAVRDVVTDVVTDQKGDDLITESGRTQVKQEILAGIRAHTDVKVTAVLIPDVAVQ